jgi:hypothetical protein
MREALMDAPEELTITQSESKIVLFSHDGRTRVLHPDARKWRSDSGESEAWCLPGVSRPAPASRPAT